MAKLKMFDDNLIHCQEECKVRQSLTRRLSLKGKTVIDKKSVQKPILVLTRTIICSNNKFFAISKIVNKQSESACNNRDMEILGWCPVWPVLPHGEKVPLYP